MFLRKNLLMFCTFNRQPPCFSIFFPVYSLDNLKNASWTNNFNISDIYKRCLDYLLFCFAATGSSSGSPFGGSGLLTTLKEVLRKFYSIQRSFLHFVRCVHNRNSGHQINHREQIYSLYKETHPSSQFGRIYIRHKEI